MMTRVKRSVTKRARKKKWFERAKGQQGRAKNCFAIAKRINVRAAHFAFVGRKDKKSNFRSKFISIINSFCSCLGTRYSQFINMFNKSEYSKIYNRKIFAILIQHDYDAAKKIYSQVMNQQEVSETSQ